MGVAFERIVIVMLENATKREVLNNKYMADLRSKGVFLSQSYGVTHSSQPNYIAAVGGDTLTLWNDDPGFARWVYEPGADDVTCVADLLDARGLTWKNYAEGLPARYNEQNARCLERHRLHLPHLPGYSKDPGHSVPLDSIPTLPEFPDEGDKHFSRKHAPFLSFPKIVCRPDYAKERIVDEKQWAIDLYGDKMVAPNLPNYSFYTPDMINDGHHDILPEGSTKPPYDGSRSDNVENMGTFRRLRK